MRRRSTYLSKAGGNKTIRDNIDTSPDIIQTRVKAGRRQFDINVELAMSNKQSTSAGAISASVGATISGGSTSGGGGVVLGGGGSGGGDGIYRCFAAHTMITLPDGTERPIGTIEILDYIMVPQPDGSIRPARVVSKSVSLAIEWMELVVGTQKTIVKPQHLFRSPGGHWTMIQDLEAVLQRRGDRWGLTPIDRKEFLYGPERLFYTLGIDDPAHAYIADGYWVKNAKPRSDDPDFIV